MYMPTNTLYYRVLKRLAMASVGGAIAFGLIACQPTQNDHQLPRHTTADSAQLASFERMFPAVNSVTCSDLHSLMVVQHDTIIYERYSTGHSADELHICWSATKTFTALAVGLAVDDGLLDVHQPLLSYLPKEELPDSLDPRWQRLTLDHVLSMRSGLTADTTSDRIRAQEVFCPLREIAQRGFRDEPGHCWRYNNADSYLAGLCVENVTGMTLSDYLYQRLFRPMGIEAWEWERDAMGHCIGGYGLHISTESLAKTGLLLLHHGQWRGQQLVSAQWTTTMQQEHAWQNADNVPLTDEEIATKYERQASDWSVGYCYQMWACRAPGSVRIDGMWGQFVIILPDKDAVCAMTTLCTNTGVQLNAFWKNVYESLY